MHLYFLPDEFFVPYFFKPVGQPVGWAGKPSNLCAKCYIKKPGLANPA
jgi:hypothetical protein